MFGFGAFTRFCSSQLFSAGFVPAIKAAMFPILMKVKEKFGTCGSANYKKEIFIIAYKYIFIMSYHLG